MSRLHVGLATLLVPEHGGREFQVTDFGGDTHGAWEMPAVVAAPDGLLMEIAYQRWHGAPACGGNVHLSRVGEAVALVNGTWTYLGSLDDGSAEDLLDEVV